MWTEKGMQYDMQSAARLPTDEPGVHRSLRSRRARETMRSPGPLIVCSVIMCPIRRSLHVLCSSQIAIPPGCEVRVRQASLFDVYEVKGRHTQPVRAFFPAKPFQNGMTRSNVGSSTNLLDVTIDFKDRLVLQFECAYTEGDMVLAMDKFLTTDEVADKMRVSRNTVIQMIDRGELRATRFGKQWRIREVDLLEYVTRNYNQPV